MKKVVCAREACTQIISDTDESYTCSLCSQPIYCSNECHLMNWSMHGQECAGATTISEMLPVGTSFAVPYFCEDMLNSEELGELSITDPVFRAHSIHYKNDNGEVSTHIVNPLVSHIVSGKEGEEFVGDEAIGFRKTTKSLGRGAAPNTSVLPTQYTLSVTTNNKSFAPIKGFIPKDMIFKNNRDNAAANTLAGYSNESDSFVRRMSRFFARRRYKKQTSSYIFWPSPSSVQSLGVEIPVSGGRIQVDLKVGGAEENVSGFFRLMRREEGTKLSRAVRNVMNSQFRTKFPKMETSNLQMYRADDLKGNTIILTFEVLKGATTAQLVDIEFLAGSRNRIDRMATSKSDDSNYARTKDFPGGKSMRRQGTGKPSGSGGGRYFYRTKKNDAFYGDDDNSYDSYGDGDDSYSGESVDEGDNDDGYKWSKAENNGWIRSEKTDSYSMSCKATKCDTSNISHMTALSMAVKAHLDECNAIQQLNKQLDVTDTFLAQRIERLESCKNQIDERARQLNESATPEPATRAVNVAAHTAVEILFQPIEGKFQRNKYRSKISNAGRNGSRMAQQLARKLADAMEKARSKTGLRKYLAKATKFRVKRQLYDLQTVVLKFKEAAETTQTEEGYQEALNTIGEALEGLQDETE